MKVMATLIEQLLGRMGLRDEPNLMCKTSELLRLLELRATNVPLQLNEYAKTMLCADIATSLLGTTFDMEQGIKLSNLRKSQYLKSKRMIEKMLDLNKIVGINDICVQLNLMEVSHKATELLHLYKATMARESFSGDDDLIHPQYAAMAIYQACKMSKRKVSKPKLLGFSNLRPTQWQQLELRWEKFLAKNYTDAINKLKNKQKSEDVIKQKSCQTANEAENVKRATSRVEDYDKWKERMLSMAKNKLKLELEQQQQQQGGSDLDDKMDKENFILGM